MDRDAIKVYVDSLSYDEVYKELQAVYMQMEKCRLALLGKDMETEGWKDGMNIGLELFQLCQRIRRDNGILKDLLRDCSNFASFLVSDYSSFPTEDVGKTPETKNCAPKYSIGDEVWYIYGNRFRHSKIKEVLDIVGGMYSYSTDECEGVMEDELFLSSDDLIEHMKTQTA